MENTTVIPIIMYNFASKSNRSWTTGATPAEKTPEDRPWTRTYFVSPSNWGGDSQNKSNISPTYLKNKIYEEKNYSGIDPDDEPCLCHGTEVGYHGTTILELQRDQ